MRGKHVRRRPWWRKPGLIALVVIVAVGAGAAVWALSRSGSSPTAVSTGSTTGPGRTSPSSTSATTAATTAAPTVATTAPTVATTTAPASTTVAVSPPVSTPGALTYTVAAGTPVKVVASRPCWIEVRASATGPILQITTLQADQSLNLAAPVWMRLGDPTNVAVTAGSTPLQLPALSGDLVISSP